MWHERPAPPLPARAFRRAPGARDRAPPFVGDTFEGHAPTEAALALAPIAQQLSRAALEGPLVDLLSRPSKGLRSKLAVLGFGLGGGVGEPPAALSAMVELLHAGSLIIDDIEDGSNERRGRPTVHVAHGVPIALNAANYLYFVPFSLLADLGLPPERELAIQRRLTRTLLRAHRGQALDLSIQIGRVARRDVCGLVHATSVLKTGSLVELALGLGAEVAGAALETIDALERFGREVGVGVQMLDDASSVRAPSRREKGLEDLRNERPTWPFAWLAAELDARRYAELSAQSRRAGRDERAAEGLLDSLGALLGDRGHAHATAKLAAAFESLRAALPDHPLVAPLGRELESLGRSYG